MSRTKGRSAAAGFELLLDAARWATAENTMTSSAAALLSWGHDQRKKRGPCGRRDSSTDVRRAGPQSQPSSAPDAGQGCEWSTGSEEACRHGRVRGHPEMGERRLRGHTAARRPLEEPELQQIGLVDLL